MKPIIRLINLRLESMPNSGTRWVWAKRERIAALHRKLAKEAMWGILRWDAALDVRLVRMAPATNGQRIDDDNLAASFKHLRDGIAAALGIDDGNQNQIAFEYGQEQKGQSYRVRIEIRQRPPTSPQSQLQAQAQIGPRPRIGSVAGHGGGGAGGGGRSGTDRGHRPADHSGGV